MSREGKASIPEGPDEVDASVSTGAGADGAESKSVNSSSPDDAAAGAVGSEVDPPLANRSASSPMGSERWEASVFGQRLSVRHDVDQAGLT